MIGALLDKAAAAVDLDHRREIRALALKADQVHLEHIARRHLEVELGRPNAIGIGEHGEATNQRLVGGIRNDHDSPTAFTVSGRNTGAEPRGGDELLAWYERHRRLAQRRELRGCTRRCLPHEHSADQQHQWQQHQHHQRQARDDSCSSSQVTRRPGLRDRRGEICNRRAIDHFTRRRTAAEHLRRSQTTRGQRHAQPQHKLPEQPQRSIGVGLVHQRSPAQQSERRRPASNRTRATTNNVSARRRSGANVRSYGTATCSVPAATSPTASPRSGEPTANGTEPRRSAWASTSPPAC